MDFALNLVILFNISIVYNRLSFTGTSLLFTDSYHTLYVYGL
jgi:hypothetical protein